MNTENKHIVPIETITRVLANEASGEEISFVEVWRSDSDKNEKEFQAIAKLWKLSESVSEKEEIDIDKEWQKMDNVISPAKGRIITLNGVVQIAASIIIVFGLSFLGIKKTNTISTTTSFAEVTETRLPDGSIINLNANSKISYTKDFGKTNREVNLKGEGFFDVSENKDLPFVVNAQGASIEVVGTRFNVKAYKNQPEVKVTVIEGVVAFFESKQPAKKAMLSAGETGVYMKKQKAIKKKPNNDLNDISWKTKYMSFNNTALKDVVEIIRNTYHRNFEVNNSIKDCTVTVTFEDKDLASVLKVLKSTLDLNISIEDDVIVISGKGCQN